MDIAGATAWMTGASSGIGEAVAKQLGARGAFVWLSGRRLDTLERVRAEGAELQALQLRASQPEALFDFGAEIVAKLAAQRAARAAPEPHKINS